MTRRSLLGAGLLVAAGYPFVADRGRSSVTAAPSPEPTTPTATAKVTRRDLVDTVTIDGLLGFAAPRTVVGNGAGVVTFLPVVGQVIDVGKSMYRVDDRPAAIVMRGFVPMWRDLSVGVDPGVDVQQLRGNLLELGFGVGKLDGDERRYTTATAAAVRAWQRSVGAVENGKVRLGDVWFSDARVRVSSAPGQVGAAAAGPVLVVTSLQQRVTASLDTTHLDLAVLGREVGLTWPDGSSTSATLTGVSAAARHAAGDGGDASKATVAVDVTPGAQVPYPDGTPVKVILTASRETSLAVPIDAIVAVAGGGFAVEVVTDTGSKRLVPVTLGHAADGWVAVTGEVGDGMSVVVAK